MLNKPEANKLRSDFKAANEIFGEDSNINRVKGVSDRTNGLFKGLVLDRLHKELGWYLWEQFSSLYTPFMEDERKIIVGMYIADFTGDECPNNPGVYGRLIVFYDSEEMPVHIAGLDSIDTDFFTLTESFDKSLSEIEVFPDSTHDGINEYKASFPFNQKLQEMDQVSLINIVNQVEFSEAWPKDITQDEMADKIFHAIEKKVTTLESYIVPKTEGPDKYRYHCLNDDQVVRMLKQISEQLPSIKGSCVAYPEMNPL